MPVLEAEEDKGLNAQHRVEEAMSETLTLPQDISKLNCTIMQFRCSCATAQSARKVRATIIRSHASMANPLNQPSQRNLEYV
jgi:hypothetical protein